MFEFIVLAMAVAAMSLTLAKAKVTSRLRGWLLTKVPWLGEMVQCIYCVSHWIAFGVALVVMPLQPYPDWLNLLITTFSLVGLAAIINGAAIKLLHWDQQELNDLRLALEIKEEEIDKARVEYLKLLEKHRASKDSASGGVTGGQGSPPVAGNGQGQVERREYRG